MSDKKLTFSFTIKEELNSDPIDIEFHICNINLYFKNRYDKIFNNVLVDIFKYILKTKFSQKDKTFINGCLQDVFIEFNYLVNKIKP